MLRLKELNNWDVHSKTQILFIDISLTIILTAVKNHKLTCDDWEFILLFGVKSHTTKIPFHLFSKTVFDAMWGLSIHFAFLEECLTIQKSHSIFFQIVFFDVMCGLRIHFAFRSRVSHYKNPIPSFFKSFLMWREDW